MVEIKHKFREPGTGRTLSVCPHKPVLIILLTDNLGLNASVAWIDIDTEATFQEAGALIAQLSTRLTLNSTLTCIASA